MRSGTTGRTGPNSPSTEDPPVAGRRSSGRRRAVPALLAGGLAVAAVALSGCASPEYRFIASSERDVVVRVPWGWSQLDSEDVRKFGQSEEEAAAQQIPEGSWSAYFDGAKKPAVGHVVGTDLSAPVVLLQSADLPESARDTITTDQLRDVFLPVSEAGRAEREVAATAASAKLPEFRLLSDTPVSTKTARGVHVVFAYKEPDGHEEVYDQVAVTDVKRTRWHVLFLHCSTQCYEARKSQFGDITDSFTIKAN